VSEAGQTELVDISSSEPRGAWVVHREVELETTGVLDELVVVLLEVLEFVFDGVAEFEEDFVGKRFCGFRVTQHRLKERRIDEPLLVVSIQH